MTTIAISAIEQWSIFVQMVLIMLPFWMKIHHWSHMVYDVLVLNIVRNDLPFNFIVCELDKDGTFAGNDAIVAVSRLCGVNIIIHQLGTPCWEVKTPAPVRKTLHIAYLRGEHYCSVLPLYPGQDLPQLVSSMIFMMVLCTPLSQYLLPPSCLFLSWVWPLAVGQHAMNVITLSLQEAKQHNHTPMHFSSSSSSPSAAAARADHVERKKDDVLCVLEATGCQVWRSSCLATWEWAILLIRVILYLIIWLCRTKLWWSSVWERMVVR